MARQIDYLQARETLEHHFAWAEQAYLGGTPLLVDLAVQEAVDVLFNTPTQSYREALLGCALARLLDPEIDVTLPYARHGERAFSGRSLDERVVNPFLVSKGIPCSRGAYLAVFRRSVRFVPETREGLKDQKGYDAFLQCLEYLKSMQGDGVRNFLRYLLCQFIQLRERSRVPVVRLPRISLQQMRRLSDSLLSRPSGGWMPVLMVMALLKSLSETYHLDWEIQWQQINVSDRAAGTGGDVTVMENGQVGLAIEVTERAVDETRVEATFQNKLSPLQLRDYLFAFTAVEPQPQAERLAHALFAQGHEVAFVRVTDWLYHNLATGGTQARERFLAHLADLLENTPAVIKSLWNEEITRLLEVP